MKRAILLFDDELEHASGYFESYVQPEMDADMPVEVVFNDEDALSVLKSHECPLALLEHLVSYGAGLVEANERYADQGLEFHNAFEFLPAFIEASPPTRYIITCHEKGGGIGRERTAYDSFPQVIGTMGWLSTQKNARLVLKTIRELCG